MIRCGKKRMGIVSLGCLLLCGSITIPPLAAEPSPSIQFLMREPVTMMDWGIKNIEDHLHRQRNLFVRNEKPLFDLEPTLTVTYNWEQNQILISITLRAAAQAQKTSQGLSDIRSHVEWIIKYLRGSLTMKPYDAFFRHRGFRSQESPQNLGAEMASQTELIISVRDQEANILSRCKGSLAGNDVTWLTIGQP